MLMLRTARDKFFVDTALGERSCCRKSMRQCSISAALHISQHARAAPNGVRVLPRRASKIGNLSRRYARIRQTLLRTLTAALFMCHLGNQFAPLNCRSKEAVLLRLRTNTLQRSRCRGHGGDSIAILYWPPRILTRQPRLVGLLYIQTKMNETEHCTALQPNPKCNAPRR